jgi:hypothetical protein
MFRISGKSPAVKPTGGGTKKILTSNNPDQSCETPVYSNRSPMRQLVGGERVPRKRDVPVARYSLRS